MTKYRLLIAASHRVTWALGRWFPNAVPLVYVTGFPKSGTTWVTQMVADVLQLPYPRLSILPVGCPAVVHGHQAVSPGFRRCVYVIRDGRDVMASLYFHLARSIPSGDRPTLTSRQKRWFPGLRNKESVAENLPAFIENQMKRPHASRGMNWGQHVARFLDCGRNDVPFVRFEELLLRPNETLATAVCPLTDETIDPARIRVTADKFSFKAQSGRPRGNEDRSSFLRSGTAGSWRKHFGREAAEIFDHYCGEQLVAAGYEQTRNWYVARAA